MEKPSGGSWQTLGSTIAESFSLYRTLRPEELATGTTVAACRRALGWGNSLAYADASTRHNTHRYTMNNGANLTPDTPHMELVYPYTQAQAVADGLQVEVSNVAAEAGIRFPVFLTRTVFDAFVTVPEGVTGQDEARRLWDIVWMLRFAIRKSQHRQNHLPFAFYVRNDNRKPRLVKLIATCGPLDIDDAQPAITVMMPDEDWNVAALHRHHRAKIC
jgi:hypothetical protein